MFPFSFEWIWDMSHMVFHGGLWYALSIIGMGVTYCIIKAVYDTMKAGDGHGRPRAPLDPRPAWSKCLAPPCAAGGSSFFVQDSWTRLPVSPFV